MKVAREDLIAAARELFREKGYAGASMQDLADRVGLKKASLYMRFPNKEALVPEVLDLTLRDILGPFDAGDTPWDAAYEALIKAIATDLTEHKRCVGLHLAYGAGDDTPVAKQSVRDFFQAVRDRLSGILAQVMPQKTAETLATDAIIRLEGATLLTAVFNDTGAMERAVRSVIAEAKAAARRPRLTVL
jgi:TetR/AcrR family transcriptional regulator, transcriptional repressor for nem operon